MVISDANGDNDLNATTLTNYGTVEWASGRIRLGNGAQIYNYGLWDCQSDQTLANDFGGDPSAFNNYGTFRKSGGVSELQMPRSSRGSSLIKSPACWISKTALMDCNCLFRERKFHRRYITTNQFGLTALSSGGFNLNGTVTGSNTWEVGGNLVGTNVIIGGLNWNLGTWNSIYMTITTNSTVSITGGAGDNDFNGSIATNYGTVLWESGRIRLGNGAQIYNPGLWQADSDETIANDFGGNPSTFINSGVFRKAIGASTNATTVASVLFNQVAGEVDVQAGNLSLAGSANLTGGFISYTPNGTTYLSSGNFTINGTLTGSNVIENAGNLVGSNVINGALIWAGGNWNGANPVTISTNSVVVIAGGGPGNNMDLNSTPVINNGTLAWQSGSIRTGNGAVIDNYGLWDAQSDQRIGSDFGGNASTINNFGTFRKSAGASTNNTQVQGIAFNNDGALDIKAGFLVLQGAVHSRAGRCLTNRVLWY